jgi:hypothetical protein
VKRLQADGAWTVQLTTTKRTIPRAQVRRECDRAQSRGRWRHIEQPKGGDVCLSVMEGL